jgi:hypothetical protein
MGILEEVRNMKARGLTQQQIVKELRDNKVSYKDISEAIAQSEIKAAVEQEPTDPALNPDLQSPPMEQLNSAYSQQEYQLQQELQAPIPSEQTQDYSQTQTSQIQQEPIFQSQETAPQQNYQYADQQYSQDPYIPKLRLPKCSSIARHNQRNRRANSFRKTL